jgi:CRISPR-associated protein Cas1
MIKRTIAIIHPAYLSLKDGQLAVESFNDEDSEARSKIKTVPIEDIGILLLDNRQITITQGLMAALAENNCAVITCDDKSMPVGLCLPLESHTVQSERFRDQIEASLPLKKQLWQQTIVAKITNQASVLYRNAGVDKKMMLNWAKDVRSGDPDNIEARAAAYYWKNLFAGIGGLDSFVRGREGPSPNNLLNYGYAILRSITARALTSSGMLPTLGIHHHNRYNAYCLADDIMEPYRPYVDDLVFEMIWNIGTGNIAIDKEIKKKLLTIPVLDVVIDGQRSPLMVAMTQTTASLYKCFRGTSRKIAYPAID